MTERVHVFIDGQNLFKGLWRRHKTRVHPLLLARELAGDRSLEATHYYTGIHDPEENRSMFDLVRRRNDLMRQTGVSVTERTLRYGWEWRIDDRLAPPWKAHARPQQANVVPYRKAREKGIDVVLALDAVSAAFNNPCDVVVIVSRDRDLMEVANEVKQQVETREVRVEVATVSEDRGDEPELPAYDHRTHIDAQMVQRCRDQFDYRRPLPPEDVEQFLRELRHKG